MNWRTRTRSSRGRSVAPAGVVGRRKNTIRRCCVTWNRWWNRSRVAIPSRTFDGPSRARTRCGTNWGEAGTTCPNPWCTAWFAPWGTVFGPTRRCWTRDTTPDRKAQFEYINAQSESFHARGLPVVSVDSKKKELVGDFKNAGQTWRPRGRPVRVRMHDFPTREGGKVTPYGVLDVAENAAWVSVGTDHDTAEFAVASLFRWWRMMGRKAHPDARELLVTADGGGSNVHRPRLWQRELQTFADRTGLTVHVCHFPPGASKWNKIEHHLFSQISLNWRGQPLVNHEAIVNLIGATRTKTGLRVKAGLDRKKCPTKVKVPDREFKALRLERHAFHGDWNYTIRPAKAPPKS